MHALQYESYSVLGIVMPMRQASAPKYEAVWMFYLSICHGFPYYPPRFLSELWLCRIIKLKHFFLLRNLK